MALGKLIEEIMKDKDFVQALDIVHKKKRGLVVELTNLPIKKIGNSSHCILPKRYADGEHYAVVQIFKIKKEDNSKTD